jgi:hypothetical protein
LHELYGVFCRFFHIALRTKNLQVLNPVRPTTSERDNVVYVPIFKRGTMTNRTAILLSLMQLKKLFSGMASQGTTFSNRPVPLGYTLLFSVPTKCFFWSKSDSLLNAFGSIPQYGRNSILFLNLFSSQFWPATPMSPSSNLCLSLNPFLLAPPPLVSSTPSNLYFLGSPCLSQSATLSNPSQSFCLRSANAALRGVLSRLI